MVEIGPKGQIMVEIDDFVYPFSTEDLVRIPREGEARDSTTVVTRKNPTANLKVLHQKLREVEPIVEQIQPTRRGRMNDNGVREVDLHIHELTNSYRGMPNGEMLQIQLEHCRLAIESAIRQKEGRIVIIHGVGQGVLRAEVHQLLEGYAEIEFHDASFRRYGRGATEVVFH